MIFRLNGVRDIDFGFSEWINGVRDIDFGFSESTTLTLLVTIDYYWLQLHQALS